MPSRYVIAKELAVIFKVIAHPDRIRLIEELRAEECDVNSLAERLDLPGPRVSQHLSMMRAHRIVEERRDGRRHLYHLIQPEIAAWIVEGLSFIEGQLSSIPKDEIETVRQIWGSEVAK